MLYCITDKIFRPTFKAVGKVQNLGRAVEKITGGLTLLYGGTGLEIQFHTIQQYRSTKDTVIYFRRKINENRTIYAGCGSGKKVNSI
jgi:hypothetical protein